MSRADLIAARPEAREDSHGITERAGPGIEATYLFRDQLPAGTRGGMGGLLAVQVDYRIGDGDTGSRDTIVTAAEARWRPFDRFRSAPMRRRVQKYSSSPPLRTAASVWDAPGATAVLYEELEAAPGAADRHRLVRLVVQEPSLAATALLPPAYRAN